MINQATKAKYTATIGIECHVQLKTKTKLFAAVSNDARTALPNSLVSHICLGMPGALPVLNKAVLDRATRAAFALGTRPQKISRFDRKHYFYPDLPKGYQITQYEQPIVADGHVDIIAGGQSKRIGITRAHLEEDAGKSTHPPGKDYSLVDLNRAGTPLLEIVSEPDMHTAEEAKAFAHELWLLMRYADVSDADLYYGNMRFDVNVSVSQDVAMLGTRSETKNLNSFKSVEKAVEYEIDRQIELLEKGETIIQETRGWDDAKQKTVSQRTKEDAHDYRYFPDPDIPPIELDEQKVKDVENSMPVLPGEIRQLLSKLKLDNSATETLIEQIPAGRFMMEVLATFDEETARRTANWLTGDIQALIMAEKLSWATAKLDGKAFDSLSQLVGENKISSTGAKVVLMELVTNGGNPLEIAKSKNLLQVSDKSEIAQIVKQVIRENPQAATDVKNGETKATQFLIGQVMKLSQGKANPGMAQELIKSQLAD